MTGSPITTSERLSDSLMNKSSAGISPVAACWRAVPEDPCEPPWPEGWFPCDEEEASVTTWIDVCEEVILSPETVAVAEGIWKVPVDFDRRM